MSVQVARIPSLHLCRGVSPLPLSNHGGHCSSNSASAVHIFASVFSSLCYQRTTTVAPYFLGGGSTRLLGSRFCDAKAGRRTGRRLTMGGAHSANLEDFMEDEDDEELELKLQPQRHQPKNEDDHWKLQVISYSRTTSDTWSSSSNASSAAPFRPPISSPETPVRRHGCEADPPWYTVLPEPPEWTDQLVEKSAKCTDLPLSLRIIKERKKKRKTWGDGIREAGEYGFCSVKKAFASMVFIVREVQTHTIRLRELQADEDLHGIMERVHREMNSSFVWLFEKVFSCTPNLMFSVMLLLANFTVYSMGHGGVVTATASACPREKTVIVAVNDKQYQSLRAETRFDRSIAKTFSVGRTASIGGSDDGGGKTRPVAGAMDDGQPDEFRSRATALPECTSSTMPETLNRKEEGGKGTEDDSSISTNEEEEERLWQDMVKEAYRMKASVTNESLLDAGTLRRLVAPVTAELELEEFSEEYFRTELMYQQALSRDPDNVLLLSNFAQFIHLVLHDDDRAEYYFKRAVGVRPADAEVLSRYANFLWLGKKDLAAAEETYLEAIGADPSNTVHTANYAHFLWNTGGEDTCYPLDTDEA